ncbi:hypothetical protein CCMSSC00406_0001511 [Pleurotus cornucopiae]|uniref:Uncharacterized protein n=1 Tax=Pleurotus cornucopiae TaxID=5321 RepID=A0ACB7IMI9_PLECO|nr:hypothetical protein CCMSSC00406_0001511 [Pleurotus cornucopiae]
MPTDSAASRRVSRKATNEEDIDARRARGEISCAECRRLKLKCDKKLPCSSCGAVALLYVQMAALLLDKAHADTAQLHSKIAEMGRRIRQLEDGLAILQSSISDEQHPLLNEDLLMIKFYPDKSSEEAKNEHSLDCIDALGTLTIGDSGDAKYFGRSAGSETLLLAGVEMDMSATEETDLPPTSPDITRLSQLFPFGTDGLWNTEKSLDILLDYLPSRPRASALCETYMEQATWSCRPIQREELIDSILTPIYRYVKEREVGSPPPTAISAHLVAVLFMVFSLGSLMDLTLPSHSPESENYHQVARAALALRSVFDSPEISTVQAIVLMASFHSLGSRRYTIDSSWSLLALACKLAQSIGLHRDSARWKLEAKTIQRRRVLWWEVFAMDLFHSLAMGRPPSIRTSYMDCEFPDDETETIGEDGQVAMGFYHWKYIFARDILANVMELTLTAATPSYQTILDLDRKVRELRPPPHLNVSITPDDPNWAPRVYVQGCLLQHVRGVTMLYIHRSFFAQALLDHPINPLRSPYAPSFLAAYRCASGIIKLSVQHYSRMPDLYGRWWPFWTHLFTAAVIVGAIVTRAPSSPMASTAFVELGIACDLLVRGSRLSRRVRGGLVIVSKLRERALRVYSQFQAGNTLPHIDYTSATDNGEDELAIFGGQTRVIASRLLSRRNRTRNRDSPAPSVASGSSSTSSPEPHHVSSPTDSLPDVHPSLVEYLSMLPSQPTSSPSTYNDFPQSQFVVKTEASSDQVPIHTIPQQSFITRNDCMDPFNSQFASSGSGQIAQGSTMVSNDALSQMAPGGYMFPAEGTQQCVFGYGPSYASDAPMNGVVDSMDDLPDRALTELSMMMSGDSAMDEQWMYFMRDSGILDTSLT